MQMSDTVRSDIKPSNKLAHNSMYVRTAQAKAREWASCLLPTARSTQETLRPEPIGVSSCDTHLSFPTSETVSLDIFQRSCVKKATDKLVVN